MTNLIQLITKDSLKNFLNINHSDINFEVGETFPIFLSNFTEGFVVVECGSRMYSGIKGACTLCNLSPLKLADCRTSEDGQRVVLTFFRN